MEVKRVAALSVNISDIINSHFVKKEGLEPSYVLNNVGMKISKAKIVGTVIDKFVSEDGNYSTLTINDESGSIRCKLFREDVSIADNVEIGDLVVVVGKVRQYAEEIYIIPSIIRKINNSNQFLLHRLDALKNYIQQKKLLDIVNSQKENFYDMEELKNFMLKEYMIEPEILDSILEYIAIGEKKIERDYKPLIIEKIRDLDKGKGVELTKLSQELEIPIESLTETINQLLEEGICYEPLPGLIKLV